MAVPTWSARENIGQGSALVAGAALLVDYTLTVAVSVSSGVLAIGSAFHFNDNSALRVGLALGFVALMALGNLRGLKEAGRVFAVPTYTYALLLGGLIGVRHLSDPLQRPGADRAATRSWPGAFARRRRCRRGLRA